MVFSNGFGRFRLALGLLPVVRGCRRDGKETNGDIKRCFSEVAHAGILQSEPGVIALDDPCID